MDKELNNKLGLYLHIPFCKTICSYCDFPKLVSKRENQKKYIDFLVDSIYNNMVRLKNVDTIYIGGGTPNAIDLDLLEEILIPIAPLLKKAKESSIELNPELVTEKLCSLLHKYNINRASLGVQTIKDSSITLLNRHHNKEIVEKAVAMLKDAGISNINIDLIFGIPGTAISDVEADLDFAVSLKPKHISYYSLILEDKTVFNYLYNKHRLTLLDDDDIADMYDYINMRLAKEGFHHYEISNYAIPGYESKHNLKYWNCDDYLGLGLGASSLYKGRRFTSSYKMEGYYNNMLEEDIILSEHEKKNEFMMLGLRKVDGIKISEYQRRFNSTPFLDFNLDNLIKNKLIDVNDDTIRINKDKLFIANLIFEEFVGD